MTDPATTDPVITDDEKDALLDGIATGEVEVHSNNGPSYAEVTPFEVGPRSRLITDSYPRLQGLNRLFASRIDKHVEQLLNVESSVSFDSVQSCTYSDFAEQDRSLSLLFEFAPKPLQGSALISLDSVAVEMLVETFYGGGGGDRIRQDAEFFSPGEITVATLFCNAVLSVTKEVWQPLIELESELLRSHLSTSVIGCIDGADPIINAEFKLTVGDIEHPFHILWPMSVVGPLLPVFEGQKQERDTANDARWQRSLRARIVDSVINISSDVGRTEMTLGEAAELVPGDVISISNPRNSIISAQEVPILEGRFGVHDGRYAVETTRWLEPEITRHNKDQQ